MRPRNGVLLRTFFGHDLGPDARVRLVEQVEAEAIRSLEVLTGVRADLASEARGPDRPYVLLTVAAGEGAARARLRWAAEAKAVRVLL